MRNITISLLLFFITVQGFAANAEFEAAVNQARHDAQSKKFDSYNHAKNFDPKSVFESYSKNPQQAKYYNGVTQTDTQQMTSDASHTKSSSESGAVISDSINQHPRFVINNTDPDIQHSQLLQSEADNIIHGVTSQYIDCKPQEICTAQYQEKSCEEAPQDIFQFCKKTLNVDVVPHATVTHYPLIVKVRTSDHNYAGINVSSVTGKISFKGPHDTSFTLTGRLPGSIDCRGLQGSVTVFNANNRGTRLDSINFPTCANSYALDFHLSGSKTINLDMQIDVASTVTTYDVKDRWVDDCSGILNEASCTLKSQQCDIPGGTRVIQGVPVTRDCWQQKFNYICRHGDGQGNCKPLQSQGCEQVGSACVNQINNQCTLYRQTYRCAIQTCAPTTDVICGNGQEYCLDGSCTDHSYKQSADFAKGVSALSAVADASQQFDPSSLTIFAGHPSECSEKPLGYSNCCTETGWGQDVGLDNCSDEAKKLHVSRENKITVKVGRYCSGPDPFPCLEHSQVFCVFNSKLAKIIQEKGRKNQLHIGFGSGKEPNCLGITAEQLQSLDLSKIDFKEFISDLNAKVKNPDLKQIQDMIQEHIKQYQKAGQSNG